MDTWILRDIQIKIDTIMDTWIDIQKRIDKIMDRQISIVVFYFTRTGKVKKRWITKIIKSFILTNAVRFLKLA